jgi:predicted Zn-dependent protease
VLALFLALGIVSSFYPSTSSTSASPVAGADSNATAAEEARWAMRMTKKLNRHAMKAYNLTEEGKYDEAITEFRKATAMKPDEYLVNHMLGQLLLMTDQSNEKETMGEAITLFRTNIKTKPNKAEARYGLAAALYTSSVENVDEVEKEAKECVKLDPEHEKCVALLKHLGVEMPPAESQNDSQDREAKEPTEAASGEKPAKAKDFKFPGT